MRTNFRKKSIGRSLSTLDNPTVFKWVRQTHKQISLEGQSKYIAFYLCDGREKEKVIKAFKKVKRNE